MSTLIEKLVQENNLTVQYTAEGQEKDGYLQGVKRCIDIVKQHSDWISVDERLPNDGDIVEVYRDSYKWGDLIWQCLYTKSKGFRNYPVDGIGKNEKITHWRPVQPPSEVQP